MTFKPFRHIFCRFYYNYNNNIPEKTMTNNILEKTMTFALADQSISTAHGIVKKLLKCLKRGSADISFFIR